MLACQAIYSTLVLLNSDAVLTPTSTISCGNFLAYDLDVVGTADGFGPKLRALRERLNLDAIGVARAALGPDSTKKQQRDFANYLSRVERTSSNVSLDMLSRIAKGMNFGSMTAFWAAVEQSSDSVQTGLIAATVPAHDALSRSRAHDHASPTHDAAPSGVAVIDQASFERIAYGSVGKITSALDRLSERVEALRSPDATPRKKAHGGRRSASARARKTA